MSLKKGGKTRVNFHRFKEKYSGKRPWGKKNNIYFEYIPL